MEVENIKMKNNLQLEKFKVSLLPYLLAAPNGLRLNELIKEWKNNEKEGLETISRKFNYDSILEMLLSEEFETIIKVERISKNDQNGFIFHGRDNQSTIFVTTEIHKSQQYKMNKELKERSRRESRIFSNETNSTILKNNSRWNNLFEKKNRSLVSMQQLQNRFHKISVEPFQRHRHRLSCRQSLEKNFAIKFKYVEGIIVREQGSPFGTNVMGVRLAHNQANIYIHPQSSSTEEDSEEEPLDFGFPTTDVENEEVLIEKPKITQAFVRIWYK